MRERLLAAEVPGTWKWETAEADVERLRDEHSDLSPRTRRWLDALDR